MRGGVEGLDVEALAIRVDNLHVDHSRVRDELSNGSPGASSPELRAVLCAEGIHGPIDRSCVDDAIHDRRRCFQRSRGSCMPAFLTSGSVEVIKIATSEACRLFGGITG